jgi:hypothetical protein
MEKEKMKCKCDVEMIEMAGTKAARVFWCPACGRCAEVYLDEVDWYEPYFI